MNLFQAAEQAKRVTPPPATGNQSMESLDLTKYNYKQLRLVALACADWTSWAASKNINAAFVSRAELEQFLDRQLMKPAEFDAALLKASAARAFAGEAPRAAPRAAVRQAAAEAGDEIRQEAPAPKPATTSPQSRPAPIQGGDAQALADLLAKMVGQNATPAAQLDPEQVKAMVESEVVRIVPALMEGFQRIKITILDKAANEERQIQGLTHKQLGSLLKACSARDTAGNHLNVWLHGPAGSGKTHAAKQVADALKLPFGFHGSMSMQHELVGFVDAGGKYHETQFVKRFREGGICLLDEVDSGENGPLLALQSALANGDMSLPDGNIITRHKDFVCIAAGNTTGQGATADYVGRTKIDGAFLSRFPILISWLYDDELERAFCGHAEFAKVVQGARAKAKTLGLKVLITPRHSAAGAALIAAGATLKEAAQATYLSGMTAEQTILMNR